MMNTGTASKAMLEEHLRDSVEHLGFSKSTDTILN